MLDREKGIGDFMFIPRGHREGSRESQDAFHNFPILCLHLPNCPNNHWLIFLLKVTQDDKGHHPIHNITPTIDTKNIILHLIFLLCERK